jgi:hypothetical protein
MGNASRSWLSILTKLNPFGDGRVLQHERGFFNILTRFYGGTNSENDGKDNYELGKLLG